MKLKYLLDTECKSCFSPVIREECRGYYNDNNDLPFEEQQFGCGAIFHYNQYVEKKVVMGLCPKSKDGIREIRLREELIANIKTCIDASNVDDHFKMQIESVFNLDVTNLKKIL